MEQTAAGGLRIARPYRHVRGLFDVSHNRQWR
jgi:hypothetical protein